MRSITIREDNGKWYMNYMKLNSEDDIEIPKEIAKEIMKFQQIKNLCSACKFHPAECHVASDGTQWHNDDVIECDNFEILSDEEIWFLKRCRNIIKRIMEDKIVIKFGEVNEPQTETCKMFCEILKDLYKQW
ncbi:MAG: hypothetical protein PHP92_03385 [Candidatus Nanoarchaeia archaeon]|nr:hypothetical protein [Candidatus Nanoarchaeia archaeon]